MYEGLWDQQAQEQYNTSMQTPELEMGERQDQCL